MGEELVVENEELQTAAEDIAEDTAELTRQAFDIDLREVDKDKMQIKIRAATKNVVRGLAILPTAFDLTRYVKNPVIMWAHNYDLPAIGKALWSKKDGEGLLQLVQFAKTQFASEIFYLYSEGFMSAWSIGWRNLEYILPEDKRFKEMVKEHGIKGAPDALVSRAMLYETSAVPLPADPDALSLKLDSGEIHSSALVEVLRRSITDARGHIEADDDVEERELVLRLDAMEQKMDELFEKFMQFLEVKKQQPTQKKAEISAEDLKRVAAQVVSGEISRIKGRIVK